MIRSQGFWSKLLRYGFCSGLALAVDVGILFALTNYAQMYYLAAAAIGFACGCAVIWVLSVSFVFDDHSESPVSKNLSLFLLIGVMGLALNHLIIFLGVDLFELPILAAKACSAVLVFWFNFFLRGILVFKDPDLIKSKQYHD